MIGRGNDIIGIEKVLDTNKIAVAMVLAIIVDFWH